MKVLISDITEEGLTIDVDEFVEIQDIEVVNPVTIRLSLSKAEREVDIQGSIRAELRMQCSRCLTDFTRDVEIPVNVVYHPFEEYGKEGHELKDDELDTGFYRDNELEIQDLVREQVLLNVQMKPLCNEECRGICSSCGVDLNSSSCACSRHAVDERLEVLKALLEKRKE